MWASADNQGNFLGRISIIRRNQVSSADDGDAESLEFFQRNISDRFSELLPSSSTPSYPPPSSEPPSDDALMSIAWLRKLLDAFLCCEAEFKATLLMDRDPTHFVKPPLDRLIPELLDRTVKALDICNAITHGVEAIAFVHKLAEIAAASLDQRPFTDGQVHLPLPHSISKSPILFLLEYR